MSTTWGTQRGPLGITWSIQRSSQRGTHGHHLGRPRETQRGILCNTQRDPQGHPMGGPGVSPGTPTVTPTGTAQGTQRVTHGPLPGHPSPGAPSQPVAGYPGGGQKAANSKLRVQKIKKPQKSNQTKQQQKKEPKPHQTRHIYIYIFLCDLKYLNCVGARAPPALQPHIYIYGDIYICTGYLFYL